MDSRLRGSDIRRLDKVVKSVAYTVRELLAGLVPAVLVALGALPGRGEVPFSATGEWDYSKLYYSGDFLKIIFIAKNAKLFLTFILAKC